MTTTAFDAWYLPPDAREAVTRVAEISARGTAALRSPEIAAGGLDPLTAALREGGKALASRPWRESARTMGSVARRLLVEGPLRTTVLQGLERTTTLTPRMVVRVLDGMARDWVEGRLERMVEEEPRLAVALDRLGPGPGELLVRARGYPLTVHIGAGSVPGVAVSSMIRALLVKSAALVKPGAGDVAITATVARAIAEEDPVLARAIAVLYWPGAETDDAVLRAADLVVVYGDDRTVESVRARARASTPVVGYPHRLSLGVVAREALDGTEADRTATAVAVAVALFDQRGCVSPHLVYVERGGLDPSDWCDVLVEAMRTTARQLPAGRLSTAEAAAIRRARDTAELRSVTDARVRVRGDDDMAWTVVFDPEAEPDAPCSGRTVTVRPIEDLRDVPDRLRSVGAVLQTVGYAGPTARGLALSEALSAVGVTRICAFESQAFPPPWWIHDGRSGLAPLVRWTGVEALGDPAP